MAGLQLSPDRTLACATCALQAQEPAGCQVLLTPEVPYERRQVPHQV